MKSMLTFVLLLTILLSHQASSIKNTRKTKSKSKTKVLPNSTVVQPSGNKLCSCYAVYASAQTLGKTIPADVPAKCTSLQSKGINLSRYAYEDLGLGTPLRLLRSSVGFDTCLAKFSTSPAVLDISWGTKGKQHVVYVVDVTTTEIIARDQQNSQNKLVFTKSTGKLDKTKSEGFWSTQTATLDAVRCIK